MIYLLGFKGLVYLIKQPNPPKDEPRSHNENLEVISEDVEDCLHIVNKHLWQNYAWVKFMSFLKQGNNFDV